MAATRGARRKFRILWVTDPWDSLDHSRDTSLRLMEESTRFGKNLETWWCCVRSIRIENHHVRLNAKQLLSVSEGRRPQDFHFAPEAVRFPQDFDRMIYRTDPPVDQAYLHPLQMLHLALQNRKQALVNPAEALALGNEKFEATRLGKLAPPGIVSSDLHHLEAFAKAEGQVVLKPLHQAQSKGVELLDWRIPDGQKQGLKVLTALTENFSRPVILQRYLPGITHGEQRLWFLDGKLLAAVRKLPGKGTFRIDMDRGGTLEMTKLNAAEKRAAREIGKLLRKHRIRMAAVDLIDGLITDFNHTSPGLLAPMEKLLGKNLARPVIEALLKTWS